MTTTTIATPTADDQTVIESTLPESRHEAYRMKLAGRPIQTIANTFTLTG
jgi:hypothetical protein